MVSESQNTQYSSVPWQSIFSIADSLDSTTDTKCVLMSNADLRLHHIWHDIIILYLTDIYFFILF